MKRKLLFMICFIMLTSCALFESKQDIVNEGDKAVKVSKLNVSKHILKNGLKVIIVENHRLPIFSYYTLFDVGGRYEKKGVTGATHFLEHLMFKGGKKYGPGKIEDIIDGSGGSNNAYTNFDSTVYYESLPSHMLEKVIDIEADRMEHLGVNEKAFESERKVILEERKMTHENKPSGMIFLKMMQAVFENTPYGLSVIGSKKDVQSITLEKLQKFHKTFYVPNNAIVIVVGDVDSDQALDLIRARYMTIAISPELDKLKAEMDEPQRFTHKGRYKREIKLFAEVPTPLFKIAYKGFSNKNKDSYVATMLSAILAGGESSSLYQRYVKGKKPKLAGLHSYHYGLQNNGVFVFGGALLPKVNLKKFKKDFLRHIKKSCVGINERDVMKVQNQVLTGFYNELDTNSGVASVLGLSEKYYNDYNHYNKELIIYNSVTVDDVKRLCRRMFNNDEYIFISAWNRHKKR